MEEEEEEEEEELVFDKAYFVCICRFTTKVSLPLNARMWNICSSGEFL